MLGPSGLPPYSLSDSDRSNYGYIDKSPHITFVNCKNSSQCRFNCHHTVLLLQNGLRVRLPAPLTINVKQPISSHRMLWTVVRARLLHQIQVNIVFSCHPLQMAVLLGLQMHLPSSNRRAWCMSTQYEMFGNSTKCSSIFKVCSWTSELPLRDPINRLK